MLPVHLIDLSVGPKHFKNFSLCHPSKSIQEEKRKYDQVRDKFYQKDHDELAEQWHRQKHCLRNTPLFVRTIFLVLFHGVHWNRLGLFFIFGIFRRHEDGHTLCSPRAEKTGRHGLYSGRAR